MKATIPMIFLVTISAWRLARGAGVGQEEHYDPSPYQYEYQVQDDKAYLNYGAEEQGDGAGDVHGSYYVNLPDGRLQKVTYTVNDYSGYIAEVSYDGQAAHPPSYHGGVAHGGGHRLGKSLVQQPLQSRPSIPAQISRSGKALVRTQETQSFSGDFFGPSSQISSNAPSESLFGRKEEQDVVVKPIPEPRENTPQEVAEGGNKASPKKSFTLERKPLKRVFKKFDQGKSSETKAKPFTTFAKAEKSNFASKSTSFGGNEVKSINQDRNKPQILTSGSRFGSFRQSPQPLESRKFNVDPEKFKSLDSERKQTEEQRKSSTVGQPDSSSKTSSGFHGFSSPHPSSDPVASSISSKVAKSHKKQNSSLIVHRPLPTQ